MPNACAHCKKTGTVGADALKRCARCKATNYCSRVCQKADWKQHQKFCSDAPLHHDADTALRSHAEAAGNRGQSMGEATGEVSMAGNYELAPLLPDAEREGDIPPNPLATATYEDVLRFTPGEVLEWLECIGFLQRYREIPAIRHALEESVLDGEILLKHGINPAWLLQSLPLGPAYRLSEIVRELRSAHGRAPTGQCYESTLTVGQRVRSWWNLRSRPPSTKR